jgi:uncharacterized protein
MASWLTPLFVEPACRVRLVNSRTGAAIAESVETAVDSRTRRRGLLGRDAMSAGEALVIAPTSAIHTWFMRFDIDVAFVNRDGRVLKVRHRMPPWRIFAALRAFAAVELPAGALASSSTVAGDTLALERIENGA